MDLTNEQIDQVVRPAILTILHPLVTAGREPRQAVQDLRRAVEQVSVEVERELAKEAANEGSSVNQIEQARGVVLPTPLNP